MWAAGNNKNSEENKRYHAKYNSLRNIQIVSEENGKIFYKGIKS